MKTTKFTFFKNTPLIDFQNTIHFKSNIERDSFFLNGGHYPSLNIEHNNFNFIRDRSTVTINVPYDEMGGVNYCTFLSEFDDQRFYAYVVNYEYLNDEAIRVYLLIDGIMTYTQGNKLNELKNLHVQRESLPLGEYTRRLPELKNNHDILKTNSKRYFKENKVVFTEFVVLIQSGVDLLRDFGTVDNPLMETSQGMVFDKITSPLNLYVVPMNQYNNLMSRLQKYPWISQNIKSVLLIPKDFLDGSYSNVESNFTLKGFKHLNVIVGTSSSKSVLLNKLQSISYTIDELYDLFGFGSQDKHLLRNEYTTTEIYNWLGGALNLDNGLLNHSTGLRFMVDMVLGHSNEISIYIQRYMADNSPNVDGSYLNHAITFNEFDHLPMLIDTATLGLAKTANQRALTESKLLTNRISSVMNPNADLKDRFMNVASLISGFSLSNLFGKFTDEYEYYRTKKAEEADLALEAPTMTAQSHGNSFNIANDNFGLHVKFSRPTESELNKIRKYYKLFGFEIDEHNSTLNNVQSNTIANFVQFTGSWSIDYADVAIVEMMKAQFENGVRLWHNNNQGNPMNQDILLNEMR